MIEKISFNKTKNIGPMYLDAASTTKLDIRVFESMMPYFLEFYGNASSNHEFGKIAKEAIEKARKSVAEIINSFKDEVIFTSGATESINLALKGFVEANPEKGNHIITVKTEHKAVLATCEYLENKGVEVSYLNVDSNGLISLEELKNSIKKETLLIAVMYVNNEIGIIQPIREIGEIARDHNVAFFCDATQAVGKISVDIERDNIDMLCFSGHKLNGPKGIGVLFKRKGLDISPLIHGGGQENNLRAGTYNTPLIVGLGKACEIAKTEFLVKIENLKLQRAELERYFQDNNIGNINFKGVKTAPHILSITLNNFEADEYLMTKSKDFVASTGSACSSSLMENSHVLKELRTNKLNDIIRISI